ncbi:MAG: prepilin-type N-terminal cleavage/methylation domain-containing protein, partial [Deltaproteobacteria bacterium]
MTSRDNAMRKNGFTLVEVLVGVVVGLIIVAGVYGVMVLTQRTSASLGRRVVTQQDTRLVLDFMASEIRMASFNPSMSGDTWINSTTTGAID